MAERKILCKRCRNKFTKDELTKIGNQNYCEECAKILTKERVDRDKLYNYIEKMFNIPYPSGWMLKQIKKFREEQGIDYLEIMKTLKYCFEVLGKNPDPKYGLSLVDYYHYNRLNYEKQINESKIQTDPSKQKEVKVVIAPTKRNNKVGRVLIDMEKLLSEEDD